MAEPSASSDATKEVLEELSDAAFKNAVAIEAISEKLAEVTSLAEELDQALRSAQQDSAIPSTITVPILVTPSISGNGLRPSDAASTSTEVGSAMFTGLLDLIIAFGKRVLLCPRKNSA